MSSVKYHEAAEEELLSEIAYLELRTAGLGRRFYREVQRAENHLLKFPESGRQLLPGIRQLPLRAFPFALIYSREEADFLILAVAHQRRRPGYWLRRSTR